MESRLHFLFHRRASQTRNRISATPLLILPLLLSFLLPSKCASAASLPAQDGKPNIIHDQGRVVDQICKPSRWYDIVFFFLLNFFAHVLTIQIRPGETTAETALSCVLVLLFPFAGLWKVFVNLSLAPAFLGSKGDDLLRAKWAGALVMVVRGKGWKAERGDIVDGVVIVKSPPTPLPRQKATVFVHEDEDEQEDGGMLSPRIEVNTTYWEKSPKLSDTDVPTPVTETLPDFPARMRKATLTIGKQHSTFPYPELNIKRPFPYIHGQCVLPEGYVLSEVPRHWHIQAYNRGHPIYISSASNILKSAAAVGQLLYSVISLYRSRGNNLDDYGWTAYPLTVVPYALMSFLNLICTCVAPEYPMRYLVWSDIMDEAKKRGGVFGGMVGTLVRWKDVVGTDVDEMGLPLSEAVVHDTKTVQFEAADNFPSGGERFLRAKIVDPTSPVSHQRVGKSGAVQTVDSSAFSAVSSRTTEAPITNTDPGLLSIPTAILSPSRSSSSQSHGLETYWFISQSEAKTHVRYISTTPVAGKPKRPMTIEPLSNIALPQLPLLNLRSRRDSEPTHDTFIIPPTSTYLATRPLARYRFPTTLGIISQIFTIILIFLVAIVGPYIVIGVVTKLSTQDMKPNKFFWGGDPEKATLKRKISFMGWLVVDQLIGVTMVGDWVMGNFWRVGKRAKVGIIAGGCVLAFVAVAGMLTAARMIQLGDVCINT